MGWGSGARGDWGVAARGDCGGLGVVAKLCREQLESRMATLDGVDTLDKSSSCGRSPPPPAPSPCNAISSHSMPMCPSALEPLLLLRSGF